MTQALSPQRERWLLLTLAGVQFTHILDFMIMMPLGPQLTRMFGISDAQFGFLVSAYTLAAGASGLLASVYIDRFDRKRLLLVLYILFGLSTLACGLAGSYLGLMAARVSAGVFGGVLSALSQTIVGDVIPFERRGRATAVVMTSFSVSTVAGVPLGLFLAAHLSWHAPFFGIAGLCAVLTVTAYGSLPRLAGHLSHHAGRSALTSLRQVLADANHLRAFVFSGLMMFAGFTVIPYITIYMRTNVGMTEAEVPSIYLAGGVATLFTARWVGQLTDRLGKVGTFRRAAVLLLLPLAAITSLQPLPLGLILGVSTLFFVCMSGRMIPGMAIVTSAAQPLLRGTFMTLNAAVQSAAMGLASIVGGLIISRDAQGLVQHYWMAGLLGAVSSLAAAVMAGYLTLHGQGETPRGGEQGKLD